MRKNLVICNICGKEILSTDRWYEAHGFENATDIKGFSIDICKVDFDQLKSQSKKFEVEVTEVPK